MRLLRLADQKPPAMDKIYFYVLQSERMIKKWMEDAKAKKELLSEGMQKMMEDTNNEASEVVESESDDSDKDSEDNVSWGCNVTHTTIITPHSK